MGETTRFIDKFVDEAEAEEQVVWHGDVIDRSIAYSNVVVIDNLLGLWDMSLDGESGVGYSLSVGKRDGVWVVYSMKKRLVGGL